MQELGEYLIIAIGFFLTVLAPLFFVVYGFWYSFLGGWAK